MRKQLIILIILGGLFPLFGQKVTIADLRQLPLEARRNYRNVKISPDGQYLSYEVLIKKSYYLYLYDLETDEFVKIGEADEEKSSPDSKFEFLEFSFSGNEVTNQLTWFWHRKKSKLYLDFIHSPRVGYFHLYRSFIPLTNFKLNRFHNQKIEESNFFEKYQGLQDFTMISYPSFSNGLWNRMPLVVMTVRKRLTLFNHAPNDPPEFLTEPSALYADIVGKFSPDDRQIVFARDRQDKCDIWLIQRQADGRWGKETKLIESSGIDVSPEWSPDGNKLAYYSDSGHPQENSIWIYDFQTGQKKEVIRNVKRNDERQKGPAWVDNKGIIFVRLNINQKDPLMYYDLETGKEWMIPTGTASNQDVDVLSMGDDYYQVAFTSRGDIDTEDDLVWTKIYVMKLMIQ